MYLGNVYTGHGPHEEVLTEKGRRLSFYRNANANRPWIRSVLPWNLLFDSRVDDLSMDGGMRWVAFRDVMSKAQIRDNPNMVNRDAIAQLEGQVSAEWLEM